jgi:uncharacterized phage-associated protein
MPNMNAYKFDEEKAKQLILYLASKVDIGMTKLMKLLYLIDFTAYEKKGKAITNDTYEHWALGPVPKSIWTNFSLMMSGLVKKVDEPRTTGKYERIVPQVEPDLSAFTSAECEIIVSVINDYGHKFQRELVEMVHEELPYKLTKENEVIPYHLAPYRNYRKLTPAQLRKLRSDKVYLKRLREAYKTYKKEKAHLPAA